MSGVLNSIFSVHLIYFFGRLELVRMRLDFPIGFEVLIIIIVVPEMNTKSDKQNYEETVVD